MLTPSSFLQVTIPRSASGHLTESNISIKSRSREEKGETYGPIFKNYTPRASYAIKANLLGCDSSYGDDLFATAGAIV